MGSRYVFPVVVILLGVLASVGCAAQGVMTSTPEPLPSATSAITIAPAESPTPVASPSPLRSPTLVPSPALNDFKYRLIAQVGKPFYCDPDSYPVARLITDDVIAQRVAELKNNLPEYEAILRHLGLATTTNLSVEQTRAVYAEGKMLNAITLKFVSNANEFSLRVGTLGMQGEELSGVIDSSGVIAVTKREPAMLACPICLAVNTLIDTPNGKMPVQDINPGILVWTVDVTEARRPALVLKTTRQPVPADFQILRVLMDDGRQLVVSPNHPTTDGRVIGDLHALDLFDGARVLDVTREPYAGRWTYDILPAGDTGTYWANGILLKSTLAK